MALPCTPGITCTTQHTSLLSTLHAPPCRDGSVVHIDYAAQFSGKAASKAQKAAARAGDTTAGPSSRSKKHRPSAQELMYGTPAAGAGAGAGATAGIAGSGAGGGSKAGYWITDARGKLYVDTSGRTLTGRQAYSAYKKEKGGGVGAVGGQVSKRKGGGGAKGWKRKGASKGRKGRR